MTLKDQKKIVPVILSGGSGTRLWPLSRTSYPKQFIKINSEKTLFQETLKRLQILSTDYHLNIDDPIIVANQEHRFLVAEQAREISVSFKSIVLEPAAKNTAAAITAAALMELSKSDDVSLLILPSDHYIKELDKFAESIQQLLPYTDEHIATFGIKPTQEDIGFGYVKKGECKQGGVCKVDGFVEKPCLETAKEFISSGQYYWNSGIYLVNPKVIWNEIKTYSPQTAEFVEKSYNNSSSDLDFIRLEKSSYESLESTSIDYAVMEKSDKLIIAETQIDWSDVGSWKALRGVSEKDTNGNIVEGDVHLEDVSNSYISSSSRLLVAVGVDDLSIVEMDDAVLVSKIGSEASIKNVIEDLKKNKRRECDYHLKVYRPWGSYETIDEGPNFQVKRIIVKPKAKLSLQMHNHRAEHWVVVSGFAEVTLGDKEFQLKENESTFIPLGEKHRLSNPGDEELYVIEVQSGGYLGEDDIVRFDDVYGRS